MAHVKQKHNILFVSHQGQIEGGADRILALIIENINQDVFQPFVLLPRRASLAREFDTKNIDYIVQLYRAWINGSKNYWSRIYRMGMNLFGLLRLLPVIKSQNIDLIYSNSLYSPMGCVLARYLKIPHIWHVHENVEVGLGKYFDYGAARSLSFANANSQAFVCISQAVYDPIKAYVDKKKVRVIYNPVPNLDRYLGIIPKEKPKSKLRLSIIGKVSPHKRPEDAIRALAIVRKYNIDAQLQVVGQANKTYVAELKSLASYLGVAEHILWLGYIEEMSHIYDGTDIVLVCTYAEGSGLVITESMAAGCPVIASNGGGVPEIIEDGFNGLLFQPKDYQTLAAHIVTLAQDHSLYTSIVKEGREKARSQYTIARYISDIEDVIYDVLSEGNKSSKHVN